MILLFFLLIGSCSIFIIYVFVNNQGIHESFVFGHRGYDFRVEFFNEYFKTSPFVFILPLGLVFLSKGFFRKITIAIYIFLLISVAQSFFILSDDLSFITIIADKGLFVSTAVFSFLSVYSLKKMHEKFGDNKRAETFLFFITMMFFYSTVVRASFVIMTCFEPMVFWEQLYNWDIYYETNKIMGKVWEFSVRSDTGSVLEFLNNSRTESRVLWEDGPQFPLGGGHIMSLAWMETNKSFANKPYSLTAITGVDLRNEFPEVLGANLRKDYDLFLKRLKEYNVKYVVAYQDFSDFLDHKPQFRKVHSGFYLSNKTFPYVMFFKNHPWYISETIPDNRSFQAFPVDASLSFSCGYTDKHFFNLRNQEREGLILVPCKVGGITYPSAVGEKFFLKENHSYFLRIGFFKLYNVSYAPTKNSVVKVWFINGSESIKILEKKIEYSGKWEDEIFDLTNHITQDGFHELRVEAWAGGQYSSDYSVATNFVVLDMGPKQGYFQEPVPVSEPTINVYEFLGCEESYVLPAEMGVAWVEDKTIRAKINSLKENTTVLLSYSFSENFRVNDSSVVISPSEDNFMQLYFEKPGFYDLEIEFFTNLKGRLAEAVSAICFLILLILFFKNK
ncbi:MAG: hypothetical protein GOU97_03210 [Nanoarchaeota archaeon]|nr:hypothetical protein [Nanoarchaeota archaeon]